MYLFFSYPPSTQCTKQFINPYNGQVPVHIAGYPLNVNEARRFKHVDTGLLRGARRGKESEMKEKAREAKEAKDKRQTITQICQ